MRPEAPPLACWLSPVLAIGFALLALVPLAAQDVEFIDRTTSRRAGNNCTEHAQCLGVVQLQPRMGQPLLGLSAEQLARFAAGRELFDRNFTEAEGLGPVFNQSSCGSCHNTPIGGSGTSTVTRFGFNDDKGAGFDPLEYLGGSLLQDDSIRDECRETIPLEANITSERVTPSTLGLGLVEAIPDSAIAANVAGPPGVSGRTHVVELLESPGTMRVGRMGWKAQVATVLSFSGDATLNEMGITNRLVPNENAPNGDAVLLAQCDAVPELEDSPDGEGFAFIDRVTDFQRFLAPPPQTPRSGMTGEVLFNAVGCAACHIPAFTTADDAGLESVLRNRMLRPYSDFLLHDMGITADFIVQGDATGRELRTPSLWGLRVRDPLWHDGRFVGGTFDSRVRNAIQAHDVFGSEARTSAQGFDALIAADQLAVVAFLNSLGRGEFDLTGDGVVGTADYEQFVDCLTGPRSFYTPDDSCAVADVDQDGDVDEADFELFIVAAEGAAGSLPDGSSVPGTPLSLERDSLGLLRLTWGASCSGTDVDYAVYEGALGEFASHESQTCSTAGSLTHEIPEPADSAYYLVVPTNGFREGSYGKDSSGAPRTPAVVSCLPQSTGACE